MSDAHPQQHKKPKPYINQASFFKKQTTKKKKTYRLKTKNLRTQYLEKLRKHGDGVHTAKVQKPGKAKSLGEKNWSTQVIFIVNLLFQENQQITGHNHRISI